MSSRLRTTLQFAPVYFIFFTWSLGTGAQNLGRPLFAYDTSGDVFLVMVMLSVSAVARVVAAPITGFLTDRVGRKPLVILGAALRGVTNFAQFTVSDYYTFLALEFFGAIGVSMWMTSSSILLADVSPETGRGRMVALRGMTMRLGFILGPAVGGALIALFGDVRYVFLFNGITKVILIVVALFLIAETRPEAAAPRRRGAGEASPPREPLRASMFLTRTFVAVVIATFATGIVMQGLFQGILPVYMKEEVGISAAQIGVLLSLSNLVPLFVALPNGMLSDRFGRKVSLVPGLLLEATACALLAISNDYTMLMITVLVFGAGQGMTMGSTQVYAMDLAPPEHRGSFLGVWNVFQHLGSLILPLVIGALYLALTPQLTFEVLGVWMGLSAVLLGVLAKETVRGIRAPKTADAASKAGPPSEV